MHKDCADETDFKSTREQGDDDVRFWRAEITYDNPTVRAVQTINAAPTIK